MKKQKILIIEDETSIAANIRDMLEIKGYEVCDIGISANDAVTLTDKHNPDLILMDIKLDGEKDGVTAAEEISNRHNIPVIYITAYSDEKTLKRVKETRPHGYIKKPVNLENLISTVDIVLYKHEMERKLKDSEEKYKELVEGTEDLITQVDAHGNFLFVNSKSEKFFGVSPEECIGLSAFSFVHPDDRDSTQKQFKEYIKAGAKTGTFENRQVSRNGETYSLLWTGNFHYDKKGELTFTNGIGRDISKRKKAEEAMEKSEKSLIEAQAIAKIGNWEMDTITKKITWSKQLYNMLEVDANQEPTFELYYSRVHPDDLAYVQKVGARFYENNEITPVEYRLLTPSGTSLYVATAGHQILDENNNIIKLAGIVQDITERKRDDEKIKQSEGLLNTTEQLTKVGGWEWDVGKHTMFWTEEVYRIHGFSSDEIATGSTEHIDRSLECYNPEDRPVIMDAFQQCIDKGQPYDLEFPFTSADDYNKWIRTTAKPVMKNGQVIKVIGNVIDITERKISEKALRNEKLLVESIIDTAQVIVMIMDVEGKIVRFNPYMENICGYKLEEVKGKSWFSTFLPKRDQEKIQRLFLDAIENIQTKGNVNSMVAKDGRELEIEWYDKTLKDHDGRVTGLISIGLDITDRKKTEQKLQEVYTFNKLILNAAGEGIYGLDSNGNTTFVNPAASKMIGWRMDELIGENHHKIVHHSRHDGKPYPVKECPIYTAYKNGETSEGDNEIFWRKDGSSFPIKYISTPIFDEHGTIKGAVITFNDITERKKTEKQIKASLKEKEILLKEIHHRIKNNMQLITSLLSIQAGKIEDVMAREPFKISVNRILSMALVHEMLYKSNDLASINFNEYINELVDEIFASNNINSRNIKSEINVKGIYLGLDRAIPCGLIITELILNTLKHAFPENKKGEIKIDFKKIKNGDHSLTVKDNGTGIPDDFKITDTKSIGFTLLKSLAKQLKGKIEVSGKKGTKVTITFPD